MHLDKELDITIYEDLVHLSELCDSTDTKNSEIRNSVHILRRLLIYGDLQKSASARKYQLLIDAPDLKSYIKAARYNLIEFYQAGGANVLGIYVAYSMISKGTSHRLSRIMKESHPDSKIQLNIQSFLRQKCFWFKGKFVTREDVIKYVANKAGNAHFDRKDREEVIDRIRSAVQISLSDDDIPTFGFNIDVLDDREFSFDPNPKNIDPIFIEVVATAKFLTESPAIKAYCKLLKNEYRL